MEFKPRKVAHRNTKRSTSKIIIPAVVSMTLLVGGLSTSAQEASFDKTQLSQSIESSQNHRETVSTIAKSGPGSPEKGMMIRSIANKNHTTDVEAPIVDEGTDEEAPEADADAEAPIVDEASDVDATDEDVTDVDATDEDVTDVDATDGSDTNKGEMKHPKKHLNTQDKLVEYYSHIQAAYNSFLSYIK